MACHTEGGTQAGEDVLAKQEGEENIIKVSLTILTNYYYYGYKIEDETGRARGTYRKRKMQKGFSRENLKERYHLEDPGIDGMIILKRILTYSYTKLRQGSLLR